MFHCPQLKIDKPSSTDSSPRAGATAVRRPRIAIMGEFSAGKSTLTNLLIGSNALPVKVTATQLPPVWLSHGAGEAYGMDRSGKRFDINLEQFDAIPLEQTQYLRVERSANVLELCDIIDFPGISDPNMPAEAWQRVISEADAILWCSHAVQAWRQSEAAFWEEIPPELHQRSLLLLTRMDKLTEERDRKRVLSRVSRETNGLFADIFPISLTRALAAGEDRDAWEASGAEQFMTALLNLIVSLTAPTEAPMSADALKKHRAEQVFVRKPIETEDSVTPSSMAAGRSDGWLVQPAKSSRIVPRRVSLKGQPRRTGLSRPETETETTPLG